MVFQWTPGGPPNPDPVDQDSQIHIAVAAKRINAVKSFLARTPELANRIDRYGWTPLYRAIYNGDEPMVRLLIDSKCDPNLPDKLGYTPLHRALLSYEISVKTRETQKQLVYLLLESNANPHLSFKNEQTPMQIIQGIPAFRNSIDRY